ncbi:MAG: NACHT domain-containing protein [Candidatus Electrothrix sp. AX5]|nr:NACHT domain-containing protein [Candidatus Electrothrix sp. AX5]
MHNIRTDIIGFVGNNNTIYGDININATARLVKPFQLPPLRADYFTGREKDIEDVLGVLCAGKSYTLAGPGGIGKTALAAEVIYRLAPNNELPDAFPDGIIFHSFYDQPSVTKAFEHIILSLEPNSRNVSEQAVLRVLAGKRLLLLLDGTEEADDLPRLRRVAGSCTLLITSRNKGDATAPDQRLDMKLLSTIKAVALLRKWGGVWADDTNAARGICKKIGGLPLAVRLVGRYLEQCHETAAEYLKWLEKHPILALHQGVHKEESVNILLRRSAEQVGVDATEVLSVLGRMALNPFTSAPIAHALGISLQQAQRLLGKLVNFGLLLRKKKEPRYEVSHPLIHTYARHQPAAFDVVGLLADFYSKLAEKESKKGANGYRCLDRDHFHIVSVLEECQRNNQWENAQILVEAIADYLELHGYNTDKLKIFKIGLTASRKNNNSHKEAEFIKRLGLACSALGKVENAIEYHQESLSIVKKIGGSQKQGTLLEKLGNSYLVSGKVDNAIRHYQQALDIARKTDDRDGEGEYLGCLGNAYLTFGNTEKAIECYMRGIDLARRTRNRIAEGNHVGNLGNAYSSLGYIEKAIGYYKKALDISRDIGHRRGEGNDLGSLGLAYLTLGEVNRSIEYHKQGFAIAKTIEHRLGQANHLGNSGNAYLALGEILKAIAYYKQAINIAREINHRRGEGVHLSNFGNALFAIGQIKNAVECHEQAVFIAREIGYSQGIGNHLANLGLSCSALGKENNAQKYWQESLQIFESIKSPKALIVNHWLANYAEVAKQLLNTCNQPHTVPLLNKFKQEGYRTELAPVIGLIQDWFNLKD